MNRTMQTFVAAATAALLTAGTVPAFAQSASISTDEMTQNAADLDMVEDRLGRYLTDLNIPDRDMKVVTLDQARRIISIAGSGESGDGARAQVLDILDE